MRNSTGILIIVIGFLLLGSLFVSSCGLSPGYKVVIVEMRDGTLTEPPKAILEVYSRDDGRTEIEVRLSNERLLGGGIVASGQATYNFSAGETMEVEIPVKLGPKLTGGPGYTGVTYDTIDILINDKYVSWKWKD